MHPTKTRQNQDMVSRDILGSHVPEDRLSRVVSRGSGNPTAGMRARTTKVQPLDGCLVCRPAGHRSEEKHLIGSDLHVKDVSARQAYSSFHVERCDHLPVDYRFLEIGGVFVQGVDDVVSNLFLDLIPVALGEIVREVLRKDRHGMFPQRRQIRIVGRVINDPQEGVLGRSAVLRIIKRLLAIFHRGADARNSPVLQAETFPRKSFVIGKLV